MIVYLGEEPKGWLATETLRHSIEARTSEKVLFKELNKVGRDFSRHYKLGTPFCRWAIPFYENYSGKVLYLDSNAVALSDIHTLFDLDMQGKGVLARSLDNPPGTQGFYTNVMLMDCAKLTHWNPVEWAMQSEESPAFYSKLMWGLPGAPNHDDFGLLPPDWNRRDEITEETKILSYINPSIQPWKTNTHPLKTYFLQAFKKAIEDETIPLDTVIIEMHSKNIYPGLLEDMQNSKPMQ